MARKHEPLNFAGSLEVQSQKPLDARRKVTLIADLTDAASFPYIYKGLDVFCEENSKWYTFLGGDSTDANNWRMEGSGGGGQDNVIESISVNGIAQAVDANKNVDLLVPTYSKNTAAFAAYDEGAEFNLQASTNGMTASWAEGTTVVSSELTSKTYVDGELAGKSSFDIASISTAGGGNEVHATLTQGEEAASLNYYKDSELPTALNLNVGEDAFRIPTTGYVDDALDNKQDTLVGGTNIKTVNGESLLGAGNVVAGMNLEVGKERWYGTYTDENGVTYQVYTKMVYIPALPSAAGITTYDHGVSNIKQILNIYGFTADGFVLNAPRQVAADNITIYQASKSASNQTFSIEVGKDRSSKKAYVVMVYAKNN